MKCYRCAHADFKTPHENQMSGFCYCKPANQSWQYLPSCHVCDKGRFQTAEQQTMERRMKFFEKCGKDTEGLK